jgi:hypothetical protein
MPPGHETELSLLPSAKVNNELNYKYTLPYVFMAGIGTISL